VSTPKSTPKILVVASGLPSFHRFPNLL
jgi:hypothetical protein